MEKYPSSPSPSKPSWFHQRFFTWRNTRRLMLGFAIVATLTAVFWAEEYWRGKRAWERCKSELQAQGHTLEWSKFIPPQFPDDLNFFKAPKMQEWFVGRETNDLSERLGKLKEHNRMVAAVVEVTSISNSVQTGDAVFYYAAPYVTLEPPTKVIGTSNAAIPLIVMDSVPLPDAIRNLAGEAGIPYQIDPKLSSEKMLFSRVKLSIRWENVTPTDA